LGRQVSIAQQTTQQAPRTAPRLATSQPAPQRGGRVQSWTGDHILKQCQSSDLVDVLKRWTQANDDRLPRLGDMTGERAAFPDTAALLLRLPNDLLCVQHGAAAARMMGRNYTGVLLSEVQSLAVKEIEAAYLFVLEHRRPLYVRFVSQFSEQHFSLEQLILPLAADDSGQPAFSLVYTAALDDKADILRAIFEHSPIGMIAAIPSRAEGSKPDDGRILLINSHAKRILKLPDSMERINTVRDLGPWFRDGALWTRTNTVSEGRQTHIHYRDRTSGTSYRLTIEPISRFMLFSIIEVLA
jgi:PAS domain-containing protein